MIARLHRRPQTDYEVRPICRVLSRAGVRIAPWTHYAAKTSAMPVAQAAKVSRRGMGSRAGIGFRGVGWLRSEKFSA